MPAPAPHTITGSSRHLARLYFEQNPLACWTAIVVGGSLVVAAVLMLSGSSGSNDNAVVVPAEDDAESEPVPHIIEDYKMIGCGLRSEVKPPPPPALMINVKRTGVGTVGRPLPLSFSLRNTSGQSLSLLPALDGSKHSMRYPKLTIEIRRPDGTVVDVPASRRCGMTNPLEMSDFTSVAPGKSLALDSWGTHPSLRWPVDEPGVYTVTYLYDLRFGGKTAADRAELDDATPHRIPFGLYTSRPIQIVVK